MFIQVITAKVSDASALKRQVERWETDVRPGATGFLGSTSGVTPAGKLIVLARFESEAAAAANSSRPEQDAWWTETAKLLTDVAFEDSVDVKSFLGGGDDNAGFVQVMRGHVVDPEKIREIEARMAEFESVMKKHRPDVIGEVIAIHADGKYTDAVYFSSEAEARAAEGKDMPPEVEAMMAEYIDAAAIDEFLDLPDPWLR